MWVLEGEEVDLYAGWDVGGLEGLELEGHCFVEREASLFFSLLFF